MCVYIYIYTHTYICIYIYIYTWLKRFPMQDSLDKATALRQKQLSEFNAEEKDLLQSTCCTLYVYIYIYTYIHRERERERETNT